MYNSTFVLNKASLGGALSVTQNSSLMLHDTDVLNNTAATGGGIMVGRPRVC